MLWEHPERGHRAAPWNAGVPAADGEALGPAYYFEHHVKLLLAPGAEPAAEPGAAPRLAEVVRPHAAHVSRNARRVRADGRAERFVTRRCRRVGARTAGARLDALTGALRARGTVQVGFSFGERLPVEPDVVLVPVPDETAAPDGTDGPPARYVRELAERLADPRAPRP